VVALGDALLNYYMHIPEPERLPDDEWEEKLRLLHWIRKKEREESES
jgi:hypothetical protein